MRSALSGLLIVTSAAWLGCGNGDDAPTGGGDGGGAGAATDIALATGDGQRGAPGSTLLSPFVVEVTDADGDPVAGVSVTWSVGAGGGNLAAVATTTDSEGLASNTLTLGAATGENTARASVEGLSGSPVSFAAQAVAPAALELDSGDDQDARISQPLAAPLTVLVKADDDLPVPGATVNWSVTSGGGSVSASSVTTDVEGVAGVTFTLGSTLGIQSARATVPEISGSAVTFNATGTQPVLVTIDMMNIAFVGPGGTDDVTIQLGDTIEWVNRDGVEHTATSEEGGVPTGGQSFESGFLQTDETFRFVPGVRGTWIYFCRVHPVEMADATLTVE